MTPEKAFQLYFAVRLHFISDYDVFKQGTNFKGKYEVMSRRDFPLINTVLKQVKTERDLIEYCVANNLYGHSEFLYDNEWAAENYNHWLTIKQSLTYTLEKDLGTIENHLMRVDGTLEEYLRDQVISDLLSRRVEFESIMMLDKKYPVIDTMQGFDSPKYKVRMYKASKFVNKGTLDHRHISHIDSFLANIKKENSHGNIIVTTT